MSNITVSGYDYVSFWREEEVGLIVLRTNSSGKISEKVMGELMMALGNASIDENVKKIAITGQNFVFCKGFTDEPKTKLFLDMARALASTLGSLEKPTFALINGDAFDFGYELALLTDEVIAAEGVRVGFYREYSFILGGSITSNKFSELSRTEAKAGINCNRTLNKDTFLEEAKKLMQKSRGNLLMLKRRMLMRNLIDALNMEHLYFKQNESVGENHMHDTAESDH